LTTSCPAHVYKWLTGREQCRSRWPFINVPPLPCLCALPRASDRFTGPLCEVLIIDHMNSSKQDVTSEVIVY
ncbi:unnamed protein product, partial [Staurois parvus]